MSKHPRQHAQLDADGEIRFVPNLIVEWLFSTGALNLHDLVDRAYKGQFNVEDLRQIVQLSGFSLDNYFGLDFAEAPDPGVATAVEQWLHEHGVPAP